MTLLFLEMKIIIMLIYKMTQSKTKLFRKSRKMSQVWKKFFFNLKQIRMIFKLKELITTWASRSYIHAHKICDMKVFRLGGAKWKRGTVQGDSTLSIMIKISWILIGVGVGNWCSGFITKSDFINWQYLWDQKPWATSTPPLP